jgi:hypothetical protein
MRRATALVWAQLGVLAISVTTAWSGILTQEDDDAAPPHRAHDGTASLLPWGVRPQIVTMAATALCVIWIANSVHRYYTYLPLIVVRARRSRSTWPYALERYRVEQVRIGRRCSRRRRANIRRRSRTPPG